MLAHMGRPSQLKDPARAGILTAIQNGAPFCDAARAVGISYDTFRSWRAQGRKDRAAGKLSAFSSFLADVEKAHAAFVTEGVEQIKAHAAKSWQARAWLLERRRPKEFADNRYELRRLGNELAEVRKLLMALTPSAAPNPAPSSPPPVESTPPPA